jgi:hypothetical protein
MRPTDRNIFEVTEEPAREDRPAAVAEPGDWFSSADPESSRSGTHDRLNGAGAPARSRGATGQKDRQKAFVVGVLLAGVAMLGVALLSDADGPRSSRSRAQVGPERSATDRMGRRTAVAMHQSGRRDGPLANAPKRSQRTRAQQSNGYAPGLRQNGRGSSQLAPIRELRPEMSAGLSPELVTWHKASITATGGEGNEFTFER